ncbi:dioxygenase [Thiohalorhabdus methylotrophus]|uniref:Dioxygenase n=1 Tax=Thiohalorhabdus methylotrophus TaxID=3242694 RepID=A0ABV4TU84_9GAMM
MDTLPSLFISHGAPTFALEPGTAGAALGALGRALPRPVAVLVVSAHWITDSPRVTTGHRPETIHDFGGFDSALYELEYPAAGHPAVAARTIEVLREAGWQAEGDEQRGLDHGAWVPLLHLYPEADVPVIQVSLPSPPDGDTAFTFGKALATLSGEGVLVVGSGSLTHNLYDLRPDGPDAVYPTVFAAWIHQAVVTGDRERLREALDRAPYANRNHPTPEHYWPLVVAAGAAANPEPVTTIRGGLTYGVLAMDAFLFGRNLEAVLADIPPASGGQAG